MKTHHLILFGLWLACYLPMATGQDNKISQNNRPINNWSPFTLNKSEGNKSILSFNHRDFNAKKENSFEMDIPLEGETLTIVLRKRNIHNQAESTLKSYNGHIKNQPNSSVSLSISENSISAFIIGPKYSYKLQSKKNAKNEVELNVISSEIYTQGECNSSNLEIEDIYIPQNLKSNEEHNTISISVVGDYYLYAANDYSVVQTKNYLTGLLGAVSTIYEQEGIIVTVEDIHVWTEEDPFDKTNPLEALYEFRSYTGGSFNGTFAHLISGNPRKLGGIAFMDGICNRSKAYGYTNVAGILDSAESFIEDIFFLTHEIGHNLGSPHTHDCVWGPNEDNAIDNCAQSSCDGPIPSEGGTIMSYCHTSSNGINLSLGFGPEPGDLIRNKLSLCNRTDNSVCHYAESIKASGLIQVPQMNDGLGAYHISATHARWYKINATGDGYLSIGSCYDAVDTRLYVYTGDCSSLTTIANSDDSCPSSLYRFGSYLDSIEIIAGTTYWIEWDDRWANNTFEFDITIDYLTTTSLCDNGVLDNREEAIDCGGPNCMPCCQMAQEILPIVDYSLVLRSNDSIQISSKIMAPNDIEVYAKSNIDIDPGFEIALGSTLIAEIKACK